MAVAQAKHENETIDLLEQVNRLTRAVGTAKSMIKLVEISINDGTASQDVITTALHGISLMLETTYKTFDIEHNGLEF